MADSNTTTSLDLTKDKIVEIVRRAELLIEELRLLDLTIEKLHG